MNKQTIILIIVLLVLTVGVFAIIRKRRKESQAPATPATPVGGNATPSPVPTNDQTRWPVAIGDKSRQIYFVQAILNSKGEQLVKDGICGSKTKAALERAKAWPLTLLAYQTLAGNWGSGFNTVELKTQ